MRSLRQCFLAILSLFPGSILAQVHTEERLFYSQALGQNRIVSVFKPDTSVFPGPLPVMIFLPGYNMLPSAFTVLQSRLDALLSNGMINPMLIVVPDGRGGRYSRSMYWNSPGVNGNHGDYIAVDVIRFVEQNFNVIRGAGDSHLKEAFILGGFSMGGGGATRLGYRWGDVFSGIASFAGDVDHRKTFDASIINTVNNQARQDPPGYRIYTPPDPSRAFEYASWGMASAFSPDTLSQYLCQFPLNEGDGTIIDSAKEKWLAAGPVASSIPYYQSHDQASMNLFFAVDPTDAWYAGPMTQGFVDWIRQNYPQAPLTYHLHTSGHSMPSPLVDSMLIWANRHFTNVAPSPSQTIVFNPVSPLSFGNVPLGSSKDTVIRLYNRTNISFTISNIALARDPNSRYLILSNTLSQPFNAGDSLLIQVRFTPTSLGTERDSIIIGHNIPAMFLSPNPYRFALTGTGTSGSINPDNYITVDNVQGAEGVPIRSADSSYMELGPFWDNPNPTSSYGLGHRRSPNLSGFPNGSVARYTFTLDQSGPYIIYQYCLNSSNIGQRQLLQLEKGGYGGIWDSLRYNLRDHITGTTSVGTSFSGTWLPLGMYYFYGVGKGAATVSIGADKISSAFLRVDASRLLRSDLPVDIEFGRRDLAFSSTRIPEESLPTVFGDESLLGNKPYRLYNLGSDTLKITAIEFYPAGGSSRTVPWFNVKNATFPIIIPPMTADQGGREQGGYADVELVFAPYQEGAARDSMVISSNDPNEPNAYTILLGDAFSVNFILNASPGNTEPHWRAFGPPEVATAPLYFESSSGYWKGSVPSNYPYPIYGGNDSSRVNIGDLTAGPHQAFYRFELPEMYGGRINTAGQYVLEYSGPATSNAATAAKVYVSNSLGEQIVPKDSVLNFNQNKSSAVLWTQIGGSTKTFALFPGGYTEVEFRRESGVGAGFLRTDLLRIRKIPTGPLIGVNVNTQARDSIFFGEINFRDPGGPLGTANQKSLLVRSIGEVQLEVKSFRVRGQNSRFSLLGAPPTPFPLRALAGEIKLTIVFTPDSIKPRYRDTLEIMTNSTRDSILLIPLTGVGVGGVFVLDDKNADEIFSQPTLAGVYVSGWDFANMNRWQLQPFSARADSAATGVSRRMLPIYHPATNGNAYFDWYPNLPAESGQETMRAEVRVSMSPRQTKASPAARYQVWTSGNVKACDTLISQNGRAPQADGTNPYVTLGQFTFLRGGRDVPGSNQSIYGFIRVMNDTAGVNNVYAGQPANLARRDTFALIADAVILRELAPPITTSIEAKDVTIPGEIALGQNYPNPFNPTTVARYQVSVVSRVDLRVYDLLGREVAVLVNEEKMPGNYTVRWDAKGTASGIYFCQLRAGGQVFTRKMILLR